MDLEAFTYLADDYNRLGGSIQDQLKAILSGEPVEDQNPNAVKYIIGFLQNNELEGAEELADELAEELANVFDENEGW